MTIDEQYMHRCIQLARKGAGRVAPNPMVGAVLVYRDRIIGEGWHQQYGSAHAEVNCINDALENGHAGKIPEATMYVSLEPCAHHGKTPPCADLLIRYRVPRVVIGCRDPFPEVNGKGIEKLLAAGIHVETGILEQECRELNKRFFVFHEKNRPYVILKWAQTADGCIAAGNQAGQERLLISNEYANRLVHRWRSEEAAILVGTHTALLDNPFLTNRLWPGPSPVRVVLDRQMRLPQTLHLFDGQQPTVVLTDTQSGDQQGVSYYRLKTGLPVVQQMMQALYDLRLQSVLVEGGAMLLQSFLDAGYWDEARILTSGRLRVGQGLAAPRILYGRSVFSGLIGSDTLEIFQSTQNN